MKIIKLYWLEIVFIILVLTVIYFSIKNSVYDIKIVNEKVMPQREEKIGNYDFVNYIERIKQVDNCTVVLAVKDVQGYCTSQKMADALKSLGFGQADILLDNSYHSFIGVYSNGEVAYQCIGGDEKITFGQMVGNQYIYVKSATYSAGNVAEIYVDDVSYAVNSRGFNIVVFDNKEKVLIDSVAYDVYVEDIPIYRRENNEIIYVESTVKE